LKTSWMNHALVAVRLLALATTLASGGASAEEAAGDWNGLLGGQLHILVHVTNGAGGHYGATLESPDQGSFVLPADKVAADADHFSFTIDKIGGSFAGTWRAEKNGWVGTWTQGQSLPLVLSRMVSRAAALAPAKRPQEEAIAGGDEQALAIAKADVVQAVADKIVPAASADALANPVTSRWAREAFAYDPVPALRQLKIPVLALNGSLDLQVPAEDDLGPIRAALQGNPRATIVELPNLNHLFQTAKLGTPAEYGDIEETFAPAALKTIADWVVAHGPGPKNTG
jgi:pimeloyl-ACP methyl ester carboxylesterase